MSFGSPAEVNPSTTCPEAVSITVTSRATGAALEVFAT